MKKSLVKLRYLRFWRADVVEDVDDELRFHIDMRVAEYVARGMNEADARRAVIARLGDVDAARAQCIALSKARESRVRKADLLDGLRADVRYAFRSLMRTPGWTAVALLTIALGVGATTAVFSVADNLLVRPFPYRDASRVYMARRQFVPGKPGSQIVPISMPAQVVRVWRENSRTIEAAIPFTGGGKGRFGAESNTIEIRAARIDTGFLSFAGAHVLIGRNFGADDIRAEKPNTVLLTEHFWRTQFGSSTDVIGKVVKYNDQSLTIVGVVPASVLIPDFRTERASILLPAAFSGGIATVLVRIKPGVAVATATEELEKIFKNSKIDDVKPVPGELPLHLTRPQDWLAIKQPLVMLTAAVGLLLLVACTNVAHLLLARGAARQRELAVRQALGAGRGRLLRQLVTESVVLALMGGALATAVGWTSLKLLAAARPATLVALTYATADHSVPGIASVLSIVAGLAIGLLAALRIAHRDLGLTLRSGATTVLRAGRTLRNSLVVGEVALSAVLLVGALLLIHSVFDLQRTQLGFNAQGLYTITVPVPPETPAAERVTLAMQMRETAARFPGVQGVSIGTSAPSSREERMLVAYEVPNGPAADPEKANDWVSPKSVEPDYFAFLGIPIVAGRTFDEGSKARNEVIISSTLARQIWPDRIAIGQQLRNAVPRTRGVFEPWQTVIGVVPDVVSNLVEGTDARGFYRPSDLPSLEGPLSGITLLVRMRVSSSTGDASVNGAANARIKQLVATLQPNNSKVVTLNVVEDIHQSMAEPRFTMRVLATFAILGVVLAAIGLFGVISYTVGQRTREIGVRMTLGATRGSIARLVVGDGIRLALIGIALGLAGAAAGTRLIQSQLFGVSRLDPFAFAAGAALLLVVAIAACAVPMMRATSIEPAAAVRSD